MASLVGVAVLMVAGLAQGFTVRDMRDQRIVLARPPQRIVSLVPSVTEDLFAIGAEDRLVGVTDFCDWPPGARDKPRVGGMVAPNLERIAAIRPDLVIATDEGNSQSTFDQLARLGIPSYVVRARRLAEAIEVLERMGALTGRTAAGAALVEALRARVRRVVDAVRPHGRRRVLYVLWPDPIIVPGREGLVTELVRLAGGDSVTAGAAGAYPRLGLEAVVAYDPEVIVLARHGGDQTPVLRATWARLAALPAIRGGRVHSVDGSVLHRYGPRVVDGLETLARIIHPEARF